MNQRLDEQLSDKITGLIDQSLQEKRDREVPRYYLGASRLGAPCERALQYEYLNAPKDPGQGFSGRVLRIFEAGHVFETLVVRWLRDAGFKMVTEKSNDEQYGFSALGGRMRGHIDGVVTYAPQAFGLQCPMLFECKSLNNKSFKDTVKKGLTLSKPVYAGQIALYQAYMEPLFIGISENPALFTAINKDTSELYFEAVPFNGALAQKASDRGVRIIDSCEAKDILPRVSRDPSFYECKMCPWQQRCWRT